MWFPIPQNDAKALINIMNMWEPHSVNKFMNSESFMNSELFMDSDVQLWMYNNINCSITMT